jgi:hypothetical protein
VLLERAEADVLGDWTTTAPSDTWGADGGATVDMAGGRGRAADAGIKYGYQIMELSGALVVALVAAFWCVVK